MAAPLVLRAAFEAMAVVVLTTPLVRASSMTARIWRPSKSGFVYPEMDASLDAEYANYLRSKDDVGLALAGGGLRGAVLAQGITRALRNHGLLERVRYMSVTSGSVWFGVAVQYQTQDTLDEFLGESMPPEKLTPEALLSNKAGSYIRRLPWPIKRFPKNMSAMDLSRRLNATLVEMDAATRRDFEMQHGLEAGIIGKLLDCFENPCTCLVDHIVPEGSLHELWILLSGYILLHPYGLASPESYFGHVSTLQRTRAKLGQHAKVYSTQDVANKLPFLLSQSAVLSLQTGTNQQSDPLLSYPLEQSPMYIGVPTSHTSNDSVHYKGLGDLLIEPFGFGSEALEPVANASMSEISIRKRRNLVNIGDVSEWAGVATNYAGDYQIRPWSLTVPKCVKTAFEKIMPHAWMWSPLNVDVKGTPVSQNLPVSDAGIYDDMGHLPLLRRGVKKIVLYDSSAVHDNTTGIEMENLCEMVYLFAAFGQPGCLEPRPFNPDGSPNPLSPKNFLTVFEPSEFGKLWSKVQELYAARKPVVIRDTFTVVDNPWFGIAGGWQVEIVWVLELPVAAWRDSLPAETRENLPSWLPNVLASEPSNQFELSAISQYGSWITEVALKEIQSMLSGEARSEAQHVFV